MQEQYTYGQKALFSIQTFMWDVNGIKKKKKKKKADLLLVVWFFWFRWGSWVDCWRAVSVSLSFTLNMNFFVREFSNSY